MLALLWQLSPSTAGAGHVPPACEGHLQWQRLGWRSRSPAGLQPPTRACVGVMVGMRRRRRKGQHSEHLLVTAFTQGLLHCGSGERPPALPPPQGKPWPASALCQPRRRERLLATAH